MDGMPPGEMLAVSLSEPEVHELLATGKAARRVALAAVNGPGQCVLSGARADLARLRRRLDRCGVGYRELRTRHAFHSQHMEPILGPFRDEVATTHLDPPAIPFGSGVTGTWITAEQASDPDYWARHVRETVRFADGLACVAGSAPAAYLEVGPGPVLASLARMQLADTVPVVSSMASQAGSKPVQAALVTAAGALWSAGVDLDWHRFDEPERRTREPLPGYPFDRTDHSLPEPAATVAVDRPAGGTPDRSGRPPAADVRRVVADQIGLMRRQLALLTRGAATSDQEVSTP
jgi:acyl transferase domain-containing protein